MHERRIRKLSSMNPQAQANWPRLQTSLDTAPALVRSPHAMSHFYPLSLNFAGPSTAEKGKSREILNNTVAPSWYPAASFTTVQSTSTKEKPENADLSDGNWWGAITKDEAYIGGIPSIPEMAPFQLPKVRRIKGKKRRKTQVNGDSTNQLYLNGHSYPSTTPSLESPRSVKLGSVVHRNVEELCEARRLMNQIQDWQRIEMDGGVLPPIQRFNEKADRRKRKRSRMDLREREKELREEGKIRAKDGGEMGEEEAVMKVRRTAAGMLAHAGFEGQ